MTHSALIEATDHLGSDDLSHFTGAYEALGDLVPRRLMAGACYRLAHTARSDALKLAWLRTAEVWQTRHNFDTLVAAQPDDHDTSRRW